MATLEQVEKLRERAHVSYDEARAALDATGVTCSRPSSTWSDREKQSLSRGRLYSSEKTNSQNTQQTTESKKKYDGRGSTFSIF
jgi:hypothetical protein